MNFPSLLLETGLTIIQEGDLILTGTPSGVGPVVEGDKITAGLADPSSPDTSIATLELGVVNRLGGYEFRS
jgi:acylpyruvate hydrolase